MSEPTSNGNRLDIEARLVRLETRVDALATSERMARVEARPLEALSVSPLPSSASPREMWWVAGKALAAILIADAAMCAIILGVSHWIVK
jgi:hypothetical protein